MTSEQTNTRTRENWDFGPRRLDGMRWYTESDAPAGVPVLDLGAWRDGRADSAARTALLKALREAVTTSGFFYVKNHGIEEAEIEAAANSARAFFGLPESLKNRFARHQDVRGYSSYRFESTARFFGSGQGKDLCMKYTMGPELSASERAARISSEVDRASNAYSPNVFPDDGFRAAWVRYYSQVHHCSMDLLSALGCALDLGPQSSKVWHEMLIDRSCGELRFLQYPDVPREACADVSGNGADRMAAHFDLDVITLLHQTPSSNGFVSLEAQIGETFVKLPPIRGTLVVNLGEVLRLLTGGHIKATVHRVVRPPQALHWGSSRDVMVFFQAPPLNAQLRPLSFGSDLGRDTLFDELYRESGEVGAVSFSKLRARLFAEFMRQAETPDSAYEQDAHLFASQDD